MLGQYEHPTLKPFFSRETESGERAESLYLFSPAGGVLVTSIVSKSGMQFLCHPIAIPVFPGASPYNYTSSGDVVACGSSDEVTDYIDVGGVFVMEEISSLVVEVPDA